MLNCVQNEYLTVFKRFVFEIYLTIDSLKKEDKLIKIIWE